MHFKKQELCLDLFIDIICRFVLLVLFHLIQERIVWPEMHREVNQNITGQSIIKLIALWPHIIPLSAGEDKHT